jgi:hypothetical protein
MAFPRPNPLTTSSSSIVDFDLLTRNKGEEEQRQAAYALLGRNGSKFKDPLDGLPPSIKARIARYSPITRVLWGFVCVYMSV